MRSCRIVLYEARTWAFAMHDSFEWPRDAFYQQTLASAYARIAAETGLLDGGKVLEVGAGAGYFPHSLQPDPQTWTSIDISTVLLDTARDRVGMNVAMASMTGLPFAAGRFAHVAGLASFDVLEQQDNLHAAEEFHRVLAEGGNLVLVQDLVPHYHVSHFEYLDEETQASLRSYLTSKFDLNRFWDEQGNCLNKTGLIAALVEPGMRAVNPGSISRYGTITDVLQKAIESEADMIIESYDFEHETGIVLDHVWKRFLVPQYWEELDLHRQRFNPDEIRTFIYRVAGRLLADAGQPVNEHALHAFIGQYAEAVTGEVYEALIDRHLRQAGFAEVQHHVETATALVPADSMPLAGLGKGNSLTLYAGSSMLEEDATIPSGMIRQQASIRWTEARK